MIKTTGQTSTPDRKIGCGCLPEEHCRNLKCEDLAADQLGENRVGDKEARERDVELFFATHIYSIYEFDTPVKEKIVNNGRQKTAAKILIGKLIHLSIIMAVATVLGVFALKIILSHYKLEHKPMGPRR
jgi:hypothetical protein